LGDLGRFVIFGIRANILHSVWATLGSVVGLHGTPGLAKRVGGAMNGDWWQRCGGLMPLEVHIV